MQVSMVWRKGHVLSQSFVFSQSFLPDTPSTSIYNNESIGQGPKPQANDTLMYGQPNIVWLLDNGAPHHVTNNLANL